MGTMEVITLDDTIDNDASLFIIDEAPMLEPSTTAVMKDVTKEVTNKQPPKRKKKRSDKKKNKKINLEMKNTPGPKWLVLGSKAQANNNIIAQMKATNSSFKRESKSQRNPRRGCGRLLNHLQSSSRSRKSVPETIVIQSDEEDVDIIELSDEEVGTIGGELSKSVQTAQNKLSEFQTRGESITAIWSSSPRKNHFPVPDTSSSKNESVTAPRNLRPIVIDGSNVAFGHGCRTAFSSRGLEICCDYFLKRGHTVKVFVPQFRRRHHATTDFHILDRLENENILVFTPSRKVDGKQVVSYDDRYIVEYATKSGGVIVSRDNYNDLSAENKEWKETINKRLLMFTWVDDMIMFPQDPLGRSGPSLEEFLSFPTDKSEEGPS